MKNVISLMIISLLSVQLATGEDSKREEASLRRGAPPLKRELQRSHKGALSRVLQNPEISEKLGLSEAQRTAIDEQMALLEQHQGELKKQIRKAALQQARLMTAEELDEAALMTAVEETGRLHTEQAKLRIRHLLFLRKTLTPEQTQGVRTIMRRRRSERGGERGERSRGEHSDRNQRGERKSLREKGPAEQAENADN